MNPCGGAIDWIRFPFEVNARIHDGPGAPVVRLRWQYTEARSVVPREGTPINNRALDWDQWSALAVGQLPLDLSGYKQDARWKVPAGLGNGHVCGRDWLPIGEPWPNTLPPSVWSASGYPDCCGLIVEPTEGGLAFGGGSKPTEGGLAFGGTAGDLFAPPASAAGGLAFGGTAGDLFAPPASAAGGLAFGGTAGDLFAPPASAAGGLAFGGEVRDRFRPR